ncbi:MAG: hypothetical protein ACE5HS_14525 [bacterium]
MQEYLDAIHRRVCSLCIDAILDSQQNFMRCGLPSERSCPIESYLNQVIEVVQTVESPWMVDYINVVRDKICANCEENEEGICDLRLKADCPLDRYIMLVAGAIEEVMGQRSTNPEQMTY